MKFLPLNLEGKNLIPLNIMYDSGTDYKSEDDLLDIVFKDLDTGQQHVMSIWHPEYEVWIVKPEYRTFDYFKNWIERDKCYPVKVHYKSRNWELGKVLGLDPKEVKYSPYIFGYDTQIEHFYMIQFLLEYPTDKPKDLSVGWLDIENDIVQHPGGVPAPGDTPINMVTYIDSSTMQSYTCILAKDDLPVLPETHPEYKEINEIRNKFYDQMEYLQAHQEEFCTEMAKENNEVFGDMEYHLFFFKSEIELIKAIFVFIREGGNDFIGIWNEPYDIQNFIYRCINLGFDPQEILSDKVFTDVCPRRVYFREDNNQIAWKRKHICKTYTKVTFIDDMLIYAGIRSARGKLPSMRLNAIAHAELDSEKINMEEEGSYRWTFYRNLELYTKYNIRDVLLQHGIDAKTHDTDSMYSRVYMFGVLSHEAFSSTYIVLNSLKLFGWNYNCGYVFGSNAMRIFNLKGNEFAKKVESYIANNYGVTGIVSDELLVDDFEEYFEGVNAYEADEDSDEDEKEEKFEGAFVMSPEHMKSTGFTLYGTAMQFIHDYVIDYDIEAEYPTAIIIMNCSNETFVGKIFLLDPDQITVEIYDNFIFRGKEREKYKMDKANYLLEIYTEGDVFNLGTIGFHLPKPNDILTEIGDNISDFLMD